MNLTEKQFSTLFPKAPAGLAPHFNRAANRHNITSTVRMAAFIAQIGHESAGLTVFEENLNYSAEGLAATWPKRFAEGGKPNAMALALARKPRAIACRVYAGRMGNGDEASCDGWKYRGRGPIQITGRDNYAEMGELLGMELVSTPDIVADPQCGILVAAAWWDKNNCNELADAGRFVDLTKKINGGTHGLEDRKARWAKAKEVLA